MITWTRDSYRYDFTETDVAISCQRCKGSLYSRAGCTADMNVDFEDDVVVTRVERVGDDYMRYDYKVPCGACGKTGLLAPIPDAEVFRRKRKSIGVKSWR